MEKPTAVVDKSFLQEACRPEFEDIWNSLDSQYLILLPFVLVEETISNIAKPGAKSGVIRSMGDLIYRRRDLILEDTLETVFRELITGKAEHHPRTPPTSTLKKIFAIRPDSPDLIEWLQERKKGKHASAKQWATLQKAMFNGFASNVLSVDSEIQYVDWLRALFNQILRHPENLEIFLQTVLVSRFIERYPEQGDIVNEAVKKFTADSFQLYPTIVQFLFARLIYVTVPRVRIKGKKLTSGQRWRDQINNFEDEQYVCSAMRFNSLITRDWGMKNAMRIAKVAGLFQGSILYWPNSSPFTLKTMETL